MASSRLPQVLFIAGTTAVGKTDLSLHLSKLINGEIISADSVQVYRHMDIGSAKVDSITRANIPHHMIDILDIDQSFNAADYRQLASDIIQDIIARGKVPIIVGGTSFYLKFLLSGPTGSPMSTNESKAAVDKLLEEDNGIWEKSLDRLSALDPEYASSLHFNDWFRLKRGLDICLQSGQTVTSFKQTEPQVLPYECCCLFLTMPRVKLFQRIDQRCEIILHNGFLKEVISLVHNYGLNVDSQAGRSIGYRQALEYLANVWGVPKKSHGSHVIDVSQEKMRKHFLDFLLLYQARTRQLAQQQLTWFKKEPSFHWLNMAPNDIELPVDLVAKHITEWFVSGKPLCPEWSGQPLQTLTPLEKEQLRTYSSEELERLTIYGSHENIDKTLTDIRDHIQSIYK